MAIGMFDNLKLRIPEILKSQGAGTLKEKKELAAYYGVSVSSIFRWLEQNIWPSSKTLIDIAKTHNCNIAYLLGLTNIDRPNTNYETPSLKLEEIMNEKGYTATIIARIIGSNPRIIHEAIERPYNQTRPQTLTAIAEAMNVSIDFLLGLTDIPQWEQYYLQEDPFYLCRPGEPAFFELTKKKDNNNQYVVRCYIMISEDNKSVIFPSGETVPKDSIIFKGSICYPTVTAMPLDAAITRIARDSRAKRVE